MRPPIPYFGGKMMLADRIIATFPPHEHFVEPFGGSLAVLLAKQPSRFETVNDLDGDLVTFWRVLRDQPTELERACALTPHSRVEHAESYEIPDEAPDLERARRVFVQLTQGRMGVRTRSGWRYNVGTNVGVSVPGYLAGYVGRIAPAVERLRMVTLECRPAIDLIAEHGDLESTLLYVDPPYVGSTRNSRYAVEMTKDGSHRELAEALNACRAAVVLSGYPSPLYDDLYAGWRRIDIDVVSTQGGEGAPRREVLWVNREACGPDLLDLLGEAS